MSQNLCSSFLLENLQGIHVLGTDVLKLALYTGSASLDPKLVTAYVATNECVGGGYVAGGQVLALTPGYPRLSPSGAALVLVDFVDMGPVSGSGFSYRYGLIYNSSKANRAVAVVDFGAILQVTASYGVVWPLPDDNNCIIRLGA